MSFDLSAQVSDPALTPISSNSLAPSNTIQKHLSLAVMNETNPVTFPRFLHLPSEIRLIIWEIATDARRIITIDHNYPSDTAITRRLVREGVPVLLSVCHESKQFALKKYQSVFTPPQPSKARWVYTGSPKSVDLRKVLRSLSLAQRGTVVTMPRAITKYMNAHEEEAEKFKDFGTRRDPCPRVVYPQWYSPKDDVLLLKAPDQYWRYTDDLWCPAKSKPDRVHAKNIAFELDRLVRVERAYGGPRGWNNRILRSAAAAAVQAFGLSVSQPLLLHP
jgi:hypothetical protein